MAPHPRVKAASPHLPPNSFKPLSLGAVNLPVCTLRQLHPAVLSAFSLPATYCIFSPTGPGWEVLGTSIQQSYESLNLSPLPEVPATLGVYFKQLRLESRRETNRRTQREKVALPSKTSQLHSISSGCLPRLNR